MKLITINNTMKQLATIKTMRNAVQTFELNPMSFFMESNFHTEDEHEHEHHQEHTQEEDNVTKIKVTNTEETDSKNTEL